MMPYANGMRPMKGEYKGRWWVLRPDDVDTVRDMLNRGATPRMIAAALNVSKPDHPKMVAAMELAR